MLNEIRDSKWFARVVIGCYLGAIVLANWLITKYGQVALPFVAFALIPFDLVARDLMQDKWQGHKLLRDRMLVLILVGGLISLGTGTGSLRVNVASCLAFLTAGGIDALTYQWMIRYGRIFRINAATLTAAITDSIIFVTIAFDEVNWYLIGLQIGMKVAGGFVWSLLLFRFFKKPFDLRQPVSPYDPKRQIPVRQISVLTYGRPPFYRKCWLCFDEGWAICNCHSGGPVRQPCNLVCN